MEEFEFNENGNNGGVLEYKGDRSLKHYKELCNERNSGDITRFDVFFAFSNEQFAKGLKSIRPLQNGEKLISIGAGGYGTKDGVKRLFEYYDEINERIKNECDPQEVYVYEYNNHESCISHDGDLEAIRLVAGIWGDEIARNINRKSAFYSVDELFGGDE